MSENTLFGSLLGATYRASGTNDPLELYYATMFAEFFPSQTVSLVVAESRKSFVENPKCHGRYCSFTTIQTTPDALVNWRRSCLLWQITTFGGQTIEKHCGTVCLSTWKICPKRIRKIW